MGKSLVLVFCTRNKLPAAGAAGHGAVTVTDLLLLKSNLLDCQITDFFESLSLPLAVLNGQVPTLTF